MSGDRSDSHSKPAPADAAPHPKWPAWRKVLAYLILFALAVASVWFINRRVDSIANLP